MLVVDTSPPTRGSEAMTDDEAPTSEEPSASDADATSAGESAPTTDVDATQPDVSPAAPAAAAATAPPAAASGERAGVFVPRWVAVLVAGLVALLLVGGAGFALGRATDDDHDDDRPAAGAFPRGQVPGGGQDDRGARPGQGGGGDGQGIPFPVPGDGGGNGGGNGGGRDLPSLPGRGVLLGVSVETVSGDTGGAQVSQVVSGSPAEDAGIEPGDVITKVDDIEITDAQELVATIREHSSGDEVTITYERDGESQTAQVTLGGSGGSGSGQSSSTS